jgi:hypothetical protein
MGSFAVLVRRCALDGRLLCSRPSWVPDVELTGFRKDQKHGGLRVLLKISKEPGLEMSGPTSLGVFHLHASRSHSCDLELCVETESGLKRISLLSLNLGAFRGWKRKSPKSSGTLGAAFDNKYVALKWRCCSRGG